MKSIQILLFSLLLMNCRNSNAEIDAVISEVIKYDSLSILKNDSVALFHSLKKFNLSSYDDNKGKAIIVPLPGQRVFIENLLFMSVDKKKLFFTKKDSLFIREQTQSKAKISIPETFEKKTFITSDSLIYKKQHVEYYEILEPIFSKDKLKAYTEINYRKKDFGCGFALLMEKINGKWKIIQTRPTWIN
ncbi:MAG: hypothetical protein CFE23_16590 [Flavobacterium sp. BFFFF1]|uniref:hypothetical protein n=1 Tax=Flavobacterium sp. BFFFF1 TaxID=2015557 RepID=UPI000BC7C5E5|nr:hypothetical protein [Flavobacterium sp. BFFFF1]OYU78879.1 MAG: hypothetical protein CFE23_16590 [Flavobacterium sp. BFFFF1]